MTFHRLGLVLALLILGVGTAWAFRHGNDFSVFFEAWRLVGAGEGARIYSATPDRFLYAPGFAWLLAPLGLLPRWLALALWSGGKILGVLWMVRVFGPSVAWGVVFLARPVLIDLQYGQVNLLILVACAWALHAHFREPPEKSRERADAWGTGLAWAALAVAAVGKIFPLPLLLLPWIERFAPGSPEKTASRRRAERVGSIVGLAAVAAVPFATEGWGGGLALIEGWRQALIGKGLPMESHNQSFAAFLHHYLSGEPTYLVSHAFSRSFGWIALSAGAVSALSWAWTFAALGGLLGWIVRGSRDPWPRWAGVAIALLIVPSHLVWKPYFVLAIPLAGWLLVRKPAWPRALLLASCFAAINLTGFDFVGYEWGGRLEAASLMLWALLVLVALGILSRVAAPSACKDRRPAPEKSE